MESKWTMHPKGEVELKKGNHEINNFNANSAGFFSI